MVGIGTAHQIQQSHEIIVINIEDALNFVVKLNYQKYLKFLNRTGKCLRQVEHIINRPFKGSCYSIFCFICNVVCPFVHFLLVILLFVLLRFTDSDYPFGILKLFWSHCCTRLFFIWPMYCICPSSIYDFQPGSKWSSCFREDFSIKLSDDKGQTSDGKYRQHLVSALLDQLK